jgi:hypothetical protein
MEVLRGGLFHSKHAVFIHKKASFDMPAVEYLKWWEQSSWVLDVGEHALLRWRPFNRGSI